MSKEMMKVIDFFGYIAVGCITSLLSHWICGTGFFEGYMVGFTMAISTELVNLKYENRHEG